MTLLSGSGGTELTNKLRCQKLGKGDYLVICDNKNGSFQIGRLFRAGWGGSQEWTLRNWLNNSAVGHRTKSEALWEMEFHCIGVDWNDY